MVLLGGWAGGSGRSSNSCPVRRGRTLGASDVTVGAGGQFVVSGPVAVDRLVARQGDLVETVGPAGAVVARTRCGRHVLLDPVTALWIGHGRPPVAQVCRRPCPASGRRNGEGR